MRGIPKTFQTAQDVFNTHRLAMSGKIDKKEWKTYLLQMIQPNKYILPIFKVEEDCFYIPYTDLPLPDEYKNNRMVYGFEQDPTPQPNPITPEDTTPTTPMPPEVIDMKPSYDDTYAMPDPNLPMYDGGPEYNPNYQPPQNAQQSELMMLKIYAHINPEMNQLVIYHGCPFYEFTGITPEEVDRLLRELV